MSQACESLFHTQETHLKIRPGGLLGTLPFRVNLTHPHRGEGGAHSLPEISASHSFFFLQFLRIRVFHIPKLGEDTRNVEKTIAFEIKLWRFVSYLPWATLGPQANLPI